MEQVLHAGLGIHPDLVVSGINIGEKVIVFNALGAKVKEVNANASNISLHVSKGIYIVRAADQATKVIVK